MSPDHPAAVRPAASPGITLTCLALSMLLSTLGISIANVALPTLATGFGASFEDVQWVVLAYLMAITAAVAGAGRLGDIIGRWRLLAIGLALYSTASLAAALAPDLPLLVAARAIQGLGAAAMMALTVALVRDSVSEEKTGRAMGLLGTMSAIGTASGPAAGGLLIGWAGWPSIFLLAIPFGLTACLIALRLSAGERSAATGQVRSFDIAGSILLAVVLIAYGLAASGDGMTGGLPRGLLFALAIAGFVLFLAIERRTDNPLIRPALLSDRRFAGGLAANLAVSAVMMSTLVVGPFYLTGSLGLDAASIGLVMTSGPLVAALSGIPSGRLVDRFGSRVMTLAGLGGIAAGCAALAAAPVTLGIAGYVLPLVATTASYALFQAANNTGLMTATGSSERGLVSGILTLSRNLGLVTGTAVMGLVFTATGGSDGTAEAIAGGMAASFTVSSLLILAAALFLLLHGDRKARPEEAETA